MAESKSTRETRSMHVSKESDRKMADKRCRVGRQPEQGDGEAARQPSRDLSSSSYQTENTILYQGCS